MPKKNLHFILEGVRSRRFLPAGACTVVCAVIYCIGLSSLNCSPQDPPTGSEHLQLKLGAQQRIEPKEISLKLEFSPEGRSAKQIRAEIAVGPGSWRYRQARAVSGASVTVSAKEQRSPDGPQSTKPSASFILLLTMSSRKQPIPSGPVGELVFSWNADRSSGRSEPDANDRPVLEIRKIELEYFGESPVESAPLEPPTAEPPANPVPACFFFTH